MGVGVLGGIVCSFGIVSAGPAIFGMGPEFHVPVRAVALALGLSVATALVGAALPAVYAWRFDVAGALRSE